MHVTGLVLCAKHACFSNQSGTCIYTIRGAYRIFLLGGLCHERKMGVSMFTFIGMINLTMVVNSAN